MQGSPQDQEKYHELALYTLEHARSDPSFIHQYIVDAYAAEHADLSTKPIALASALIGLCLFLDKGYSGRQVQLAHIQLAKQRKNWPHFPIPADKGLHTAIADVVAEQPGVARNAKIKEWCASVWHM